MNNDDRETLAARLKSARDRSGITNAEIAHTCGVTPQAVGAWLRTGKISGRHLASIAATTGVSTDWLITGRDRNSARESAAVYDLSAEARPIRSEVPLISWVTAGAWCGVVDNLEPGEAEEWVQADHNVGENAFALTVRGDSMEPEFRDGVRIVVDPSYEATDGSYVIARLDDDMEATFKQLVIDGSRRYLKPLNDRYLILSVEGNMTICGVVRSQSKTYA